MRERYAIRSGGLLALALGVAALIAAIVLVVAAAGDSYAVDARFQNASQIVKGNLVKVAGRPVGTVEHIALADDGQAVITMTIDEPDVAPLRDGTQAAIRQRSLSGIADRYVDLLLPTGPAADNREIPDGGEIDSQETSAQVDLDELLNTFDPPARASLQDFFEGSERAIRGQGENIRRGLAYLNPALSQTSRVFDEAASDRPALRGFVADSERLVSALASRRTDLAEAVGNLNGTFRALAGQRTALSDSIGRLPGFMRRANTTFVNLRSTLDELDPVVAAATPVLTRPGAGNDLSELLPALRRFADGTRPAAADLDRVVSDPGPRNDLIELTTAFPQLAQVALDRAPRTVAPGGRRFKVNDGEAVPGAFDEITDALAGSTPIIAGGRPYTPALFSWFDDFSTTGPGTDALGPISRSQVVVNATTAAGGGAPLTLENLGLDFGPLDPLIDPVLESVFSAAGLVNPGDSLIPSAQRGKLLETLSLVEGSQLHRCPGASDPAAPDGSNVLSQAEQERLNCREEDRAVGEVP